MNTFVRLMAFIASMVAAMKANDRGDFEAAVISLLAGILTVLMLA